MIFEMLRWWYGTGWLQAMNRIGTWTKGVERIFSITILLKTLFAPWRRIISGAGKSFDDKIRAALDNFVSRCVGFVVRSFTLVIAAFATLGAFLGGVVMVALWPLLPLMFVYFLVRGIIG